jgi:hypothetical protein
MDLKSRWLMPDRIGAALALLPDGRFDSSRNCLFSLEGGREAADLASGISVVRVGERR